MGNVEAIKDSSGFEKKVECLHFCSWKLLSCSSWLTLATWIDTEPCGGSGILIVKKAIKLYILLINVGSCTGRNGKGITAEMRAEVGNDEGKKKMGIIRIGRRKRVLPSTAR